jgi:hypothetical protein
MTRISFLDGRVVLRDDQKVGSEADCCCQPAEPCCPCTDVALPESCDPLQSIVADFSFDQAGNCQNPGVVTVTITAADQANGFPFSKTVAFAVGAATMTINVYLFCDGVAGCYVLEGFISVAGCSFCNGLVQGTTFTQRLNGSTNEQGDCCPSGNESSHTIEFCEDFSMTLSSTLVY